jgi:hypothetical protein
MSVITAPGDIAGTLAAAPGILAADIVIENVLPILGARCRGGSASKRNQPSSTASPPPASSAPGRRGGVHDRCGLGLAAWIA